MIFFKLNKILTQYLISEYINYFTFNTTDVHKNRTNKLHCIQTLSTYSYITFLLITLQSLPKLQHDIIPTRRKYYILSNKFQLIAHLHLNLSKVLFLMLTYFSLSNLVLTLCFTLIISGSIFVLLQSHRYNFAISNNQFSKGRFESIIGTLRNRTAEGRRRQNSLCD